MNKRVKITLLFTGIMFLLLCLLCGFVYSFFYSNRIDNIKTQLTNRAISLSYMMRHAGKYDLQLMKTIDSAALPVLTDKSVQVYNAANNIIFSNTGNTTYSMAVSNEMLAMARKQQVVYFTTAHKDAVLYYDKESRNVILSAANDKQGKTNLEELGILLCIGLAVSIVIAFISGFFFSRLLLRPVKRIADQVNAISLQNITQRLQSGDGPGEWDYLTQTINELLNRLQESLEIQRRFLSAASHELLTPLTSISSQLEVSLLKEREAAAYRQVMQSVYQDVRQLSKLTQTLLEFASLSGNPGGIELSPVRIDEVLMRLPGEIIKMNNGYNVKFEFEKLPEDETKLFVYGNAALLFTAIKNIVSNACKYSTSKLAVIKLSVEKNEIIIAVKDDGKGIPEKEIKNIFQPFYRIEDDSTVSGFGVGLPLVKRIVKLHNGQINIKSVPGKGTTFFVHLPCATKPVFN
ncbi:HAMP domain-containing sensor histidine kinase [Ferruginibacter profundus]